MIRKLYALLTAVVIISMIVGCGSATTAAPQPTQAPPTAVPATKAPEPTKAPEATKPAAPAATKAPDTGVTTLKNKSGSITISVPSSWKDVNGDDEKLGNGIPSAQISASTNLKDLEAYKAPGVSFYASASLAKMGGFIQVLDELRGAFMADCKYDSKDRFDYTDGVFEGKFDLLTDCKGTGNAFIILAGRPIKEKTALLVFMGVNFPKPDDKAVDQLKLLLDSFDVMGPLP